MSKSLGKRLPSSLLGRIGPSPEASGKAILLVTVDEGGVPHAALLSHQEVAVKDRGNIRLCTRSSSRTAENLRRRGRAALLFIDEGPAYYIKGKAQELKASMSGFPTQTAFNVKIEEVLEDEKPGFPITSGIRFKPPEGPEYPEQGRAIARELLDC